MLLSLNSCWDDRRRPAVEDHGGDIDLVAGLVKVQSVLGCALVGVQGCAQVGPGRAGRVDGWRERGEYGGQLGG
ncbi:hypothetical protein E0504_32040 [Parafrankia sp. BMG5.11]|nr:hypothetical protein E0504_32040 [Parafrankia sp. BMG5.11]